MLTWYQLGYHSGAISQFSCSKSLKDSVNFILGQIILTCLDCVDFLDFTVAKFNGYQR